MVTSVPNPGHGTVHAYHTYHKYYKYYKYYEYPGTRVSVMISPDNLLLTRHVPSSEERGAVAPS